MKKQSGYMLLESLVSMFIFSIGILGLLNLQAVSIKSAGEAYYRADASFLTNSLIDQMWSDDRTPLNLQTQYQTGGNKYAAWFRDVQAQLPGASHLAPTVIVTPIAGSSPPQTSKSQVAITVRWQVPGGQAHIYTGFTEIK